MLIDNRTVFDVSSQIDTRYWYPRVGSANGDVCIVDPKFKLWFERIWNPKPGTWFQIETVST